MSYVAIQFLKASLSNVKSNAVTLGEEISELKREIKQKTAVLAGYIQQAEELEKSIKILEDSDESEDQETK